MSKAMGNEMTNQRFSPCPDTPNCVSSREVGTRHYIVPLRYSGSIQAAKTRLLEVVNSFSRTRVLEDDDTYIRARFTSLLLRFTDDVEFQFFEEEKLIHMKSASRVGYYDLGANRRRCEAIRNRFQGQ